MASRKPLVLNAGQIQQLQSGDTLDAVTTTQYEVDIITLGNPDVNTAIPICTPVALDATGDLVLAQADVSATSKVLGLARAEIAANSDGEVQTDGAVTATTGEWDIVTGGANGLVPGTIYYLDPDTAGMLADAAPVNAGDYVVEIGEGISTTKLELNIKRPVKL
jgi:hypothetical protein